MHVENKSSSDSDNGIRNVSSIGVALVMCSFAREKAAKTVEFVTSQCKRTRKLYMVALDSRFLNWVVLVR